MRIGRAYALPAQLRLNLGWVQIRDIPFPDGVKAGIDSWTVAAGIRTRILLRSINKAGKLWGTGFSPKVIWGVVKQKKMTERSRGWNCTTSGAHAPVSAIRPVVNWNRFSFCWDMFQCKRRNAIWAANSDSVTRSTIVLAWTQRGGISLDPTPLGYKGQFRLNPHRSS
jgi:hypothetical protein